MSKCQRIWIRHFAQNKMGQLMLLDNRKLYVCERVDCYEVLNGDDFDLMDMGGFGGQIGSYGKRTKKEIFIRDVINSFGIKDNQLIWLKYSDIPRVDGKCSRCKNIKSFEKWECEHYGENKVCHRCLLGDFSKDGFFERHFSKERQKEFLEEIKIEEKGRTLI